MARGRKPVPTKLRKARGNPRRRPMNEKEPEVKGPVGDPPLHLNATERQIWRGYAKEAFWLTATDRADLEVFVTSYWMMIRVKPEVEKGLILRGPNGGPVHNPYLAIYNKAKEQVLKSSAQLGLSSTAIGRIRLPEKKEEDEFAEFEARGFKVHQGGKK